MEVTCPPEECTFSKASLLKPFTFDNECMSEVGTGNSF